MRAFFANDIYIYIYKNPTDTVVAGEALEGSDSKLLNLWFQTVQVFPRCVKLLERYVLCKSLIPKWVLHYLRYAKRLQDTTNHGEAFVVNAIYPHFNPQYIKKIEVKNWQNNLWACQDGQKKLVARNLWGIKGQKIWDGPSTTHAPRQDYYV